MKKFIYGDLLDDLVYEKVNTRIINLSRSNVRDDNSVSLFVDNEEVFNGSFRNAIAFINKISDYVGKGETL